MNPPNRPNKYTLRAPPPIPPRPGSVPNSGDATPSLPPRPSATSGGYPPPQGFPRQQQTQPSTYNPAAAYGAAPGSGPRPPQQPPQMYHQPRYSYSAGQSGHYSGGQVNERLPPPPPYGPFSPTDNHAPGSYSALNTYQRPQDTASPSYGTPLAGNSWEAAGAYSQPPTSQRSDPPPPRQAQSTESFTNPHVPEQQPSAEPQLSPPLFSQERESRQYAFSSPPNPVPEERTPRTYAYSRPQNQEPENTSQRAREQPNAPTTWPIIQYNPPEVFTLRACPYTTFPLTGSTPWYIHPEVPGFRICTYCYKKHIESSRFRAEFRSWTAPAGSKAHCLFDRPRIEEQLWPWALQSGNLQQLVQFFKHRLTVRNCPGERSVSASENIKWYRLRERNKLPHFVACEACYQDVLLASPITDGFVACNEIQDPDSTWSCDVAVSYIRRLALKVYDSGTFAADAGRYMELPACPQNGEMVDSRSRKWYRPRNSASGVTICEHCYGQYAVRTDFEHYLEPVLRPYPQQQCILGLWQASCLWGEALERKDFSMWENRMAELANTPPCALVISHGGKAYQIQGVPNFDICQRCYVGVMKPHGLDKYLKQVQSTATSPRGCDLNPSAQRFTSYAAKMDEAMLTCTFSTFTNFAARVCSLDPCPRLDEVKGRSWYGGAGYRMCPSCYEEVARGSELARHFPDTPVTIPGEEHCDLYSARMRAKWAEACEARDPAVFMQFAAFRKSVYDQTVPEMRHLVAMAKLNLGMQQMYNTTSSFYNNMNGVTASMYSPYVSYGAAGLPHRYETPWGVHGAQLGQTAQGYCQGIGADTARVGQLQAMWDQVE
ncbi:hypothetical protein BJX76DRAFT_360632 [Aspergillus varians]